MKRRLIYGQALLFLFVFITFGLIIVSEKGDVLKEKVAKKKIDAYYNEHYRDLTNIKKGNITYQEKDNSYSVNYSDIKIKDLSFTLTYKKREVTSTYQDDYVERESILSKREQAIKKAITETLVDGDILLNEVSFYKFDDYLKAEQELIISNNDLRYSKLYTVKVTKKTNSLSDIDSHVASLLKAFQSEDIYPEKITFILKNRSEELKVLLTIKNDGRSYDIK